VKQTTHAVTANAETTVAAFDVFARVATVFPCTFEVYKWIMAHLVRTTTGLEPQMARVASFTFLRLYGRYYLGNVLDDSKDSRLLSVTLGKLMSATIPFGVHLYEVLLAQRGRFPNLPVPYVLHFMCDLLKSRGGLRLEGIFRNPGTEGLINEIRSQVNFDMSVLRRGDANVLANLIKMWLLELPSPLVPVELLHRFIELGGRGSFRAFFELLPTSHRKTLLYLVGLLQELCKNAALTGMDIDELATIFGPCIVNPLRTESNNPAQVQKITTLSVSFCRQIIQEQDASSVYPLNIPLATRGKLKRKPPPKPEKASFGEEPAGEDEMDPFGDMPMD
jgi:hypothetical protein